nr:unnamed protein product [Digitaria exilis]
MASALLLLGSSASPSSLSAPQSPSYSPSPPLAALVAVAHSAGESSPWWRRTGEKGVLLLVAVVIGGTSKSCWWLAGASEKEREVVAC